MTRNPRCLAVLISSCLVACGGTTERSAAKPTAISISTQPTDPSGLRPDGNTGLSVLATLTPATAANVDVTFTADRGHFADGSRTAHAVTPANAGQETNPLHICSFSAYCGSGTIPAEASVLWTSCDGGDLNGSGTAEPGCEGPVTITVRAGDVEASVVVPMCGRTRSGTPFCLEPRSEEPGGWTATDVPPGVYSFRQMWGSGSSDIWATAMGAGPMMMAATMAHWDGTAWTASQVPGGGSYLLGVWGSGPTDAWAVGGIFSGGDTTGNIVRWNGTSWDAFQVPSHAGTLFGVWGRGPADVWAVGRESTGTSPAILHWNGTEWASSAVTGAFSLNAVWGSGANDVWAVGEDTFGATAAPIVHWDGTAWATSEAPDGVDVLLGVWGSGPSDVWAVGFSRGVNFAAVIVHWDGEAWTMSNPACGASRFESVWGSSPNDVWAVGDTIAHWDGMAWTTSPLPARIGLLNSVWGSGPGDVWAVGQGMAHRVTTGG